MTRETVSGAVSVCQVTLEFKPVRNSSAYQPLSSLSTTADIRKVNSADVLVLEEEKRITITDQRSKNTQFSYVLKQFMYYNGFVERGRIGLKILESRFNPREVMILINSVDLDLIQELNEGILNSQNYDMNRRGRSGISKTPSNHASPNNPGRSPEMKKSKQPNYTSPELRMKNRFGFGNTANKIKQMKSPQLSLASTPIGVNADRKLFSTNNSVASRSGATTPAIPISLSELSSEQQAIVQAVQAGQSIFFTGSGGCGKSFLLKKLISILPQDSTAVTASTGVAACHINGTTLHHFLGVGKSTLPVPQIISKINKNFEKKSFIKKTKILIIDEISLVDEKLFELAHEITSTIRGNAKFFGGIQLVCCGDFLQLPPVCPSVVPPGEKPQPPRFCFESRVWRRAITRTFQLTKVFRQEDLEFSSILNEIRFGICSDTTASLLLGRVNSTSTSGAVKLLPLNREVEEINDREMSRLENSERQTFIAIDTVYDPAFKLDSVCPAKTSLTLIVGARVILLATLSISEKLVNGSVGTVERLSRSPAVAYVRFDNNPTVVGVSMHDWSFKQNGSEVARRRQLPLSLAWAISIHKSQGMTLEQCEVGLDKIFEAGQAYVALSRCKSIDGLSIISPSGKLVTAQTIQRAIRANPVCVDYYRKNFS